ncbi:G protein pathway suppressor 2 [Anoplophora glabripennis]|uniref:G protein pathway suppressor 2 n=1 Tax=Anoplophora glabripennis TaxID=217634 RepID=UPI0008748A2B|nr:G protein pathway suppressor 2 [Anoplophora glabripennis]
MPAAVQDASKPDHSEQMWKVLKAHILRERARKKQEREQEVEEERLRKEREAREQQDVMTLGETREQITQLEAKLTQLKEEKHQLFLQLKKVLNEDDNRRRQLVKENTEQMIAIQPLPANYVHSQLHVQPQPFRLAPMPQQQQPQQQQATFKTTTKRPRSPSPQPQVPVSLYHGYGYKPPTIGTTSYQGSPQKDDGRRNELVRAVLWNKTPQYTSQPSAFYPVAPQELSMYYPTRNVFESPRPQAFHLEQKLPEHYTLRTPSSHGHVIHPGSLPINPPQSQPKSGSITAGYPVRSQTQYQQSPAPASLYTAQSRPLYQSSGAPMNYPSRE